MLTRACIVLLALISVDQVAAESPLFLDLAIGQTFFHVPEREESLSTVQEDTPSTSVARSVRAGVGASLGKVVDLGVAMWFWGDSDLLKDEDSERDSPDTPEDVVWPELWGVGTDLFARLTLPLSSAGSGPYVEYGRLCWTANITNLGYEWRKNGCSVRRSIGLALRDGNSEPRLKTPASSVRLAFDWMDLDDVELYQLMLNAQIHF